MSAIYQPLKSGELLRRLGYAQGRFILEGGGSTDVYTQDYAARKLHGAREVDSDRVSEDEITQMLAAAREAGMAASFSVIRERVSRLAADLPKDLDMGKWGYETCTRSVCHPEIRHGRVTKQDEGSTDSLHKFEAVFAFCWAAVEENQMTTDQAVLLLHQAGELPLDDAEVQRIWEAIPETRRAEIERERIERLGGEMLFGGLPPELAETLGRLLGISR